MSVFSVSPWCQTIYPLPTRAHDLPHPKPWSSLSHWFRVKHLQFHARTSSINISGCFESSHTRRAITHESNARVRSTGCGALCHVIGPRRHWHRVKQISRVVYAICRRSGAGIRVVAAPIFGSSAVCMLRDWKCDANTDTSTGIPFGSFDSGCIFNALPSNAIFVALLLFCCCCFPSPIIARNRSRCGDFMSMHIFGVDPFAYWPCAVGAHFMSSFEARWTSFYGAVYCVGVIDPPIMDCVDIDSIAGPGTFSIYIDTAGWCRGFWFEAILFTIRAAYITCRTHYCSRVCAPGRLADWLLSTSITISDEFGRCTSAPRDTVKHPNGR